MLWKKGVSVQIEISQVPGWDADSGDSELLHAFFEELWNQIYSSDSPSHFPYAQTIRKSTVVTFVGGDAEQMLALALPYLKQAGLPEGTKVFRVCGLRRETVDFHA